jgi:MarR family transcriptional regulator for hemolysin
MMPIGLQLSRTAKAASRAFDQALAEAGGTLSTWLVLIGIKSQRLASQRELAQSVGIEGATLTHHLNAMERQGLLTRQRDPANRRVHVVELTEKGEALFHQLRTAATTFDRRLRAGLDDDELEAFARTLSKLQSNVERASVPALEHPAGRAKSARVDG